MSEHENEPQDSVIISRPEWRYIFWGGWNYLAMAWIGVGTVAGAIANLVFASWLAEKHQLHGAVAIAVGVSVVIADIVCRARDAELRGWRRFTSSIAGGTVLFVVPAWLIGLGIIATGIATALGLAKV